jgi:trypsin
VINRSANAHDVAFAQSCVGSLVRADTVLTAAHCVKDRPATGIDVIVAADNLCAGSPIDGERRHVVDVLFPPAEKVTTHDAAILLLEGASTVEPVELGSLADGMTFSLGWGKEAPAGSPECGRRVAELAPAMADDCAEAARRVGRHFSTEAQLCLRPIKGSRNTCAGDSGGPVLQRQGMKLAVVGLTSWGTCRRGDVGVYVRTDQLRGWLAELPGPRSTRGADGR